MPIREHRQFVLVGRISSGCAHGVDHRERGIERDVTLTRAAVTGSDQHGHPPVWLELEVASAVGGAPVPDGLTLVVDNDVVGLPTPVVQEEVAG